MTQPTTLARNMRPPVKQRPGWARFHPHHQSFAEDWIVIAGEDDGFACPYFRKTSRRQIGF
jgi:hypothetical protein